jgi:nitrogen fixation NifU-like protein
MAYDMYQEKILEHYRKPRNFGHLDHVDTSGKEANPLCGDNITVELLLDETRSKVMDVRFSGEGCAISVASASMLSQEIKGKTLKELSQLTQKDIEKLIAVPLSPVRIKCALTPLAALNHALDGIGAPRASEPKN